MRRPVSLGDLVQVSTYAGVPKPYRIETAPPGKAHPPLKGDLAVVDAGIAGQNPGTA